MRHLTYYKVFENEDSNSKLNEVFPWVKDIIIDLSEDHDIDYEINFGEYHKMWPTESSKVFDSINIDLQDNKYNFFRFNDHILPAINTLKSYLADYELEIDIELVVENEFYPVDEFVEEYGTEEFHELGIIIWDPKSQGREY